MASDEVRVLLQSARVRLQRSVGSVPVSPVQPVVGRHVKSPRGVVAGRVLWAEQ